MKTICHINRHEIRQNKKRTRKKPVITCKTSKSNDYGYEAILYDDKGREMGRLKYTPEKPLSCGAEAYLDYRYPIKVVKRRKKA